MPSPILQKALQKGAKVHRLTFNATIFAPHSSEIISAVKATRKPTFWSGRGLRVPGTGSNLASTVAVRDCTSTLIE